MKNLVQEQNEGVEIEVATGDQQQLNEKKDESKMFSQEELDRIVKDRIARAQAKLDKRLIEFTEAQKLQSMKEDERKQEQFFAEYEELKAKNMRFEMSKVATALFVEQKIAVTEQILDLVISKDADSTKLNTEAFIELVNEIVLQMVEDKLRGITPKTMSGISVKSLDEIAQIKDVRERHRELENYQKNNI